MHIHMTYFVCQPTKRRSCNRFCPVEIPNSSDGSRALLTTTTDSISCTRTSAERRIIVHCVAGHDLHGGCAGDSSVSLISRSPDSLNKPDFDVHMQGISMQRRTRASLQGTNSVKLEIRSFASLCYPEFLPPRTELR